MKFQDYYETLNLARNATPEEIKRAYRKLARKFHPDVSKLPDAELRFKALGEAYAVLKDPEKRAAYDAVGSNWKAGQDFQPPPGWESGFEFSGRGFGDGARGDTSDFFEAIFGRGGRSASRPGPSRDHHAHLSIDLLDAYRGARRSITLRMPEIDADGRGSIRERSLDVSIPKGVRAGQHLRLAGQGASVDGKPGDLYLEIAFNPDPRFRVDGRDVYSDLPLAPWEAALGASISAPTPEGAVQLTIPAESLAGRQMRLKGRGIPGSPAGDLYLVLAIALPPADTQRARDAYQAMELAFEFNPRAHLEASLS